MFALGISIMIKILKAVIKYVIDVLKKIKISNEIVKILFNDINFKSIISIIMNNSLKFKI